MDGFRGELLATIDALLDADLGHEISAQLHCAREALSELDGCTDKRTRASLIATIQRCMLGAVEAKRVQIKAALASARGAN